MSHPPMPSTVSPGEPTITLGWSTVRNLIGALIAAVAGLVGGAGGAAAIKAEVPAEVREALADIRNTLTKIETRDEARMREANKLEARVDTIEKDVQALKQRSPSK